MVAPPAPGLVIPPLLLTVATEVSDELQLKVGEIWFPAVSNTVATTVELVPLTPLMVVPPVMFTASAMDWTGHVVNVTGPLVVLAIEAEIWVIPGARAETVTCPFGIPEVFSGVTVATED
jgi:hypothetical protein